MLEQNTKAKLLRAVESALDANEWNYSVYALEKIINKWYESKRNLIAILSKHPNWNPEKFMIQFDKDFDRPADKNVAWDFLYWLYFNSSITYRLRDTLYENEGNLVDEKTESYLKTHHPDLKIVKGQKLSRAVNKLCEKLGVTKDTDYNKRFAMYSDAINPLTITRHTVISLNPVDYLLMSNGNSWDSCHNIEDGPTGDHCYCAGTLSYMLDEVSMVFYTVDKDYEGNDIEFEEKINRQMFMYQNEMLLQSRLYPQCNDNGSKDIYTQYRNVMQKIFADCLEVPNMWTLKDEYITNYVNTVSGNCAYPDWQYFNTYLSILKTKEPTDDYSKKHIYVGARPICIECGSEFFKEGTISCCSYYKYCEHCDAWIRVEDEIESEDGWGCIECVSQSEGNGRYYYNDDMYHVNGVGYVGREELDCYYYCPSCDEYYRYCDDGDEVDGTWYCEDCLNDIAVQCEECGEWIFEDEYDEYEVTEDGSYLCYDCYEDYLEKQKEKDEEKEDEEQTA